MTDFSVKTRNLHINKLQNEKFDLLIIGGGITGAGVARDAALRGLKVALVEASDFASGTSSRSSKLVHGGIRYLENYEFHLVFEALSERAKLFEMAPHLVHPLRFMIPLFQNSRVTPFLMGMGMFLYDLLALFQTPEMHEKLDKIESLNHMPILRGQDLVGSFLYSDAYMDDDRLVHETLRSAHQAGAISVNYVKALSSEIQNHKVKAVLVKDVLTSKTFSVQAEHVVCTVGPWTDLVGSKLVSDWKNILRPTKGVHITLSRNRLNLSSAVVMAAQKSSRIVFAIPRHEMIIVGTTDTDFQESPEKVSVTSDDIAYLLRITNEYFPGAKLTEEDIISSYAGVRPLVKDGADNEGKTSREHTIISDEKGFTFVAGGKYTTYRLMSEQIVDKVIQNFSIEKQLSLKPCETEKSLNKFTEPENYRNAIMNASSETEEKLTERYGLEAYEIIRKYGSEYSVWQLEAFQAIHQTMCFNLVDFYSRRVPLFLSSETHGLAYLPEITEIFEKELGWPKEQSLIEQEKLIQYMRLELSWKNGKDIVFSKL